MKKGTKVLLIILAILILAAAGLFLYQKNSGKLNSSADTLTPTPSPVVSSTTVTVPLTVTDSEMGATLSSFNTSGSTNVGTDRTKSVAVVTDKNANTYVGGMLGQLWYKLAPLSVKIPDSAQNITLTATQDSIVMPSWGVNICSSNTACVAQNANALNYNGAPWKPTDLNNLSNVLYVGFVNPTPNQPLRGFKLSQLDVSITYSAPSISASLQGKVTDDQQQNMSGLNVAIYKNTNFSHANSQDLLQVALAKTTTDSAGHYLVQNLPIVPVWISIGNKNSSDGCSAGTVFSISLVGGENYAPLKSLSSGIVVKGLINKWDDATQSLIPDAGATVKLDELNGDSSYNIIDVVLFAPSDSAGNYQFCVDASRDGHLVNLISPANDYHRDKQFKVTKPVTIGPPNFY